MNNLLDYNEIKNNEDLILVNSENKVGVQAKLIASQITSCLATILGGKSISKY